MNETAQSVGCIDAATQIMGDKWTPLLLRFFINEETVRFCQLQDLVGGINPRTLSARLSYLEECDIIQKTSLQLNSRCDYALTQKGRDLLPILQNMQTWSDKYAPINV
jgi:DNA-binding HxlR family transcriptional regulator